MNQISSFLFIFIISFSLAISPVISSPLFYSQKGNSVAFAQTFKTESQESAFLPLVPNVAFAQSDKSAPSDSFSLTVTVSTSCPGLAPVPAGTNRLIRLTVTIMATTLMALVVPTNYLDVEELIRLMGVAVQIL